MALSTGLLLLGWMPAHAASVSDTVVADVTPRALSVIWALDEAVIDATVRVYADATGFDEITGALEVDLLSPDVSLDRGVVKVTVSGLEPNTLYFVGTETTAAGGDIVEGPEPGVLLPILSAARTTRANSLGEPIANDLIADQVLEPDGESDANGALLVVAVPGVSRYALTAFVGEDITAPEALVDLNNLFADVSGTSADVPGGAVLQLTSYRGTSCPAADQAMTRLRRVPSDQGAQHVTELAMAAPCFAPDDVDADLDCDGRIGVVDLTRLGSRFGLELPDCRFDSHLDLDDDGRIGIVDLTRFGSVFGAAEQ